MWMFESFLESGSKRHERSHFSVLGAARYFKPGLKCNTTFSMIHKGGLCAFFLYPPNAPWKRVKKWMFDTDTIHLWPQGEPSRFFIRVYKDPANRPQRANIKYNVTLFSGLWPRTHKHVKLGQLYHRKFKGHRWHGQRLLKSRNKRTVVMILLCLCYL